MIFGLVSPPSQTKIKNLGGVQNFFVKNEKNQSCSKLPKLARKLVKPEFWIFSPHPKFLWREYKKIGQKLNLDFLANPPSSKKLLGTVKNVVKN